MRHRSVLIATLVSCLALHSAHAQTGGEVTGFHKITSADFGAGGPGAGDTLGHAVAFLGDLDGDTVPDIAIGESRDDDGGTDAGAVWIVFLNVDGTIKGARKITEGAAGFQGTLDGFDEFGSALGGPGDIDGDSVPDLVVGAWGDDDGAAGAGAVWVLFLNPNGTVKAEQKISATAGGFGGELLGGDAFGISVSGLGDWDGDGTPDLAVGARFSDDGGPNRGAAWLIRLNPDGTVKQEHKIASATGGFKGRLADDDNFGSGVAGIGDVDGDGVVDLAVGAMLDDDGGSSNGAVWIVFLHDIGGGQLPLGGGVVRGQQKISALKGGFAGPLFGDNFGSTVGALGDYDGDGVPDVGAGARLDAPGSIGGTSWLLLLNPDGTVKDAFAVNDSQTGFGGVLASGDEFGNAIIGIGDLSGDGVLDLAVGAWLDDDGGGNAGAVYLLNLAPACIGGVEEYASGCAGSGGFVPHLTTTNCPTAGQTVNIVVEDALGGALTLLLIGLGPSSTPLGASGCTLNVTPIVSQTIAFPLGGSGPGNGTVTLFAPIPASAAGVTITLQAFVGDPPGGPGFANSNGLELRF